MTLQDFQWSYRGLVFGDGVPIAVNQVDGLEGVEARVADRDLPRGDGAAGGFHWGSAKQVGMTLEVGGTPEQVETQLAQIRAGLRMSRGDDHPLRFKLPGMPERRLMCRPIRVERVMLSQTLHLQQISVVLRAADPRLYSEVQHQRKVPVFVQGNEGYFDYPADYPKDSDTAGGDLEAVARNTGDSDAFPLVTFTPVGDAATSVTLVNRTNGAVLSVETNIAVGQTLTCRMREYVTGRTDQRIISLDGISRYADWVSRPAVLRLSPGDNVLRFTVEGTDDASCWVRWRDTWDGSDTGEQ